MLQGAIASVSPAKLCFIVINVIREEDNNKKAFYLFKILKKANLSYLKRHINSFQIIINFNNPWHAVAQLLKFWPVVNFDELRLETEASEHQMAKSLDHYEHNDNYKGCS